MPVWATRDCQKRLEKEKKRKGRGEKREKEGTNEQRYMSMKWESRNESFPV